MITYSYDRTSSRPIPIDKDLARKIARGVVHDLPMWLTYDPADMDNPLKNADGYSQSSWGFVLRSVFINTTDVRGRSVRVPIRVTSASAPRGGIRRWVAGGSVSEGYFGDRAPKNLMKLELALKINNERTPNDLLAHLNEVEKELYSVLIHEITHLRDLLSPSEYNRKDLDPLTQAVTYHNDPTEVRAFMQQIADEVIEEAHNLGKDNGGWFFSGPNPDGHLFNNLLELSDTWDRIRRMLTPVNLRLILKGVARALQDEWPKLQKAYPDEDKGLRQASRFAGGVIPFKPKPGVPTITLGGRKYLLSTDGGPLGDLDDPSDLGWFGRDDGEGGARVIHTPVGNKWKFLWVYDTEKQLVFMWRTTDGNEKASGPAREFTSKIVKLERKGQLNRVTHDELRRIQSEMNRIEDENLAALQRSIEENKDDLQRKVDELVRDFYRLKVEPRVERAIQDVRRGVTPIGFKPFDSRFIPVEKQVVQFAIGQVLAREFTPAKVNPYLKSRGIDLEAPGMDCQASLWAIEDVKDGVFATLLPSL